MGIYCVSPSDWVVLPADGVSPVAAMVAGKPDNKDRRSSKAPEDPEDDAVVDDEGEWGLDVVEDDEVDDVGSSISGSSLETGCEAMTVVFHAEA